MVDKIKIKCDLLRDGMPFYLCRSQGGKRLVWSSHNMPLELDVEDAFRLAELHKFVVVEFVAHCLHVVSRASFDELNKKEPVLGFVVVKIGGGGDALNKPDGAVGSGESLAFGGDAHGVAPVVEKGTLAERRALVAELDAFAQHFGEDVCSRAAAVIAQQQAEIQDLDVARQLVASLRKYLSRGVAA